MGKIEDVKAWQVARQMHQRVLNLLRQPSFRGHRYLVDQLERASATCMTNIAEGYGSRTTKQVSNGFSIAIGSAVEVQSLLYTCSDAGLITTAQFQEVYDLAVMTLKLSKAFVASGRRPRDDFP